MFRRRRSAVPADGSPCELCGRNVTISPQGRCPLGHWVVAAPTLPEEVTAPPLAAGTGIAAPAAGTGPDDETAPLEPVPAAADPDLGSDFDAWLGQDTNGADDEAHEPPDRDQALDSISELLAWDDLQDAPSALDGEPRR